MKMLRIILISTVAIMVALGIGFMVNKPAHAPTHTNEQLNVPEFVDIGTAASELRWAYWGSHGWWLCLPRSSDYLFATLGSYVLRYDIASNAIDRALKMTTEQGFEPAWSFAPDGKTALAHIRRLSDGMNQGTDFFLEFDKQIVTNMGNLSFSYSWSDFK